MPADYFGTQLQWSPLAWSKASSSNTLDIGDFLQKNEEGNSNGIQGGLKQ